MRNQWRLLLRLNNHHHNHHSLHRLFHTHTPTPLSLCQLQNPSPISSLFPRHFSTSSTTQPKDIPTPVLVTLFAKTQADITQKLKDENLAISHDMVLEALKDVRTTNPSLGIRIFNWVLENDKDRLSSNCYNLMLGMLGTNGYVKEFWEMVEEMKGLGYGVKGGAFSCVLEKFEKDGLSDDVERLKGLFGGGDVECNVEDRILKVVKGRVWDDDVEKEVLGLGVSFSSEIVRVVLEKMSLEPMKGLIFFRWVEESGLFKHDETTYNAMAVVLAREDCRDRFWNLVEEMRSKGFELGTGSCVKVLDRFLKRKMVEDAVRLYEFSMSGANKLSPQQGTMILRKVVAAEKLELEMVRRVIKALTENGFDVSYPMYYSVTKALAGAGKLSECVAVVGIMVKYGFKPDARIWQSLLREKLISGYCKSGRAGELVEFMSSFADLKVPHDTYKDLISVLLKHKEFEMALSVLPLMRKSGFPPSYSPFVRFVSEKRSVSVQKAIYFLERVSEKDNPSPNVYLRIIKAFIRCGHRKEVQDILEFCPQHIRNDPDVLTWLVPPKSKKSVEPATVTD